MKTFNVNNPLRLVFNASLIMAFTSANSAIAVSVHQHGKADLQVVIENNLVHVTFIAPADSIVGFEHKALSKEELKRVNYAEKVMRSYNNIVGLTHNQCETRDVAIELGDLLPAKTDNHGAAHHHGHDEDHHQHDDHGEHDEHDEHTNYDDSAHHSHDGHQRKDSHDEHQHFEVSASYQLACQDLSKLTSISVNAFAQFHSLESVKVVWLKDNKQGAVNVTSATHLIQLK